MLGRTHAISGAAAWLAAAPLLPSGEGVLELAAGTAIATYSALLPDIDEAGSKASRALLGPFRRIAHETLLAPLVHRAHTHYLLVQAGAAALAWAALAAWAPGWTWLALPFFVGLVAHSLGDCCTTAGVRLLWPMGLVLRFPIRTGGKVEMMIVAPLVTFLALYLVLARTGVVR